MVAVIRGLASTVPSEVTQQELWDLFFAEHYEGDRRAERIWNQVGVERRHAAVIPFKEDVRDWSTGARMRRFPEEAVPLGREALEACLENAGLAPRDVDLLTVVTCTGYGTPGLDIVLAREIGFRDDVQRLQIGHMGCYAAVPGLAAVSDAVTARDQVAVLLSLELPSLHIQPAGDAVDQIVAHALFADAAAAVAVTPGDAGLAFVDIGAVTDSASADLMTWDVTDLGFQMGLSPRVPDVLRRHAAPLVDRLLAPSGLRPADVRWWAIHPGGPRILEVVADELGLDTADIAGAAEVLKHYGNCSSATVLLVLQDLLARRSLERGDPVVAMAFGPGLTLYAALLRMT